MERPVSDSMRARLSGIKFRVQVPLAKLLSRGHLEESELVSILDAVEWAGVPGEALGFVVAYQRLRSERVPVDDVVRLARELKSPINLDWSPGRWRLEHKKLVRVSTLKFLCTLNARYDLKKFDRLIPEIVHGYLIRTSRRLGMEGVRQRHCVGVYHNHVASGVSAFASMFVKRQRWTVELRVVEEPTPTLRIEMIRGRLNEKPSWQIVEAIQQQLGMRTGPETVADNVALEDGPHAYLENVRRVLPVLRSEGVQLVTVEFDGGGDNTDLDVDFGQRAKEKDEPREVEVLARLSIWQRDQSRFKRRMQTMSLEDALKEITEEYLDATGIQWYDDLGAFGKLLINVETGQIALEVKARYVEDELAYERTLDIATGKDV